MPPRRIQLPTLALSEVEADALLLGLLMVAEQADEDTGTAARGALAKVAAALPPELPRRFPPGCPQSGADRPGGPTTLGKIGQALRDGTKLRLCYADRAGTATRRVVWPVALNGDMLAAWCELRSDFRNFRLDRISEAATLDASIPRHPRVLRAEWLLSITVEGIW